MTVAIVTAMEPPVVLLDEPTTAQDYRGRYEIMDLMLRLNGERGITVIVITHDMEIVSKYCERVVVIGQGNILLEGSPKEVFSQVDVLEQTFLKPPPITQLAQRLAHHGLPPDILNVEEFVERVECGVS